MLTTPQQRIVALQYNYNKVKMSLVVDKFSAIITIHIEIQTLLLTVNIIIANTEMNE